MESKARSRKNTKPKKEKKPKEVESSNTDTSDEDEGELCFICTEPIVLFAVASCDHRTCHKCTLRLRALYETRNCAYCKTEQKVVIFTKDAEKPFENYKENDTPFTDKKLSIKFETQAMYNDSLHMLDYNCPYDGCEETSKNWGELKQHVRRTHNLHICDLCSRFKKIFPFEHTLYTASQLATHLKEGDKEFNKDDETGFTGHPECAFCKIRFFGDDELFVHCRDQHEQCFLCVRNGRRHEYYANYSNLEEHFKAEHCMCLHPECLEKKFVVFDSPIDLKAHEVEVHGESSAGLQRSLQSQSRQLQLNFQYESFREQQQRNRKNNNNNNNNKKKENNSEAVAAAPAVNNNREAEFPSVNEASSSSSLSNPKRVVPGASTKKGKKNAIQKPAGFGALSQPEQSSSQSTATTSQSSTSHVDAPASVVASHSNFLSKVGDMLQSKAKVAEFRSLTGSYRKSEITCQDYVNRILALTNNNVEMSGKIFAGVENLLDIEEKKWELIRVWRNKQTALQNFPALDTKGKGPAPKSARVLVIKGPKTKKKEAGGKNVWDKVASAATVATSTSSRTSSAATSARSSPQSSRPSSPLPVKPPKENEFPSLKKQSFPSLPKAPPKHQIVMNMRRNASGSSISNAWGSSGNSSSNEEEVSTSTTESSNTTGKKKKGRKNNVLFRVGL